MVLLFWCLEVAKITSQYLVFHFFSFNFNFMFLMYLQMRGYFEKEIKSDFPGEPNKVIVKLCNAHKSIIGRCIKRPRSTPTLYIR